MDKQQTFSMVTGDYISGRVEKNAFISRVEAGSNNSTVAQRVVGADKNGSLKSETLIYGHKSLGTRTQEWLRWPGPAAIVNDRPALSSERAPQINKPATVWQ
jgi:hypothetical protein